MQIIENPIKKRPETDRSKSLAAHIQNNANIFIADILAVAEMLTDADVALCRSIIHQWSRTPENPEYNIPLHI